jgi:hypothetical protein
MDKLYTDFPPASFDNAKIILQADPVTGALTKTNIPNITTKKIALLIINQSGTANPVITVVSNNTGFTFSASRIATGMYNIVASATMYNTASTIILSSGSNKNNEFINFQIQSSTSLFIFQFTNLGVASDLLNHISVSIEIA